MLTITHLRSELAELQQALRNATLAMRLDLEPDGTVRARLHRNVALQTSRLQQAERAVAVAESAGTRGALQAANRAVLDAWRATGTVVD